MADNKPVLCVRCHKSTIQSGSGWGTIPPLTVSIHSLHATVTDPDTGITLGNSPNRSACYHCHPGASTHALRGVMGDAVAPSGARAIQCQSCHGGMTNVAAINRTGWIDLPDCQSCHTGTATSNNGQIRYTDAFTNGVVRQAIDSTFATVTNLAFGNYSLYRYSTNHGKLFCSACHGSPHAEFPADRNDNLRVLQVQSHEGMLSDCNACHTTIPNSGVAPHGGHEFGPNWVNNHLGLPDYLVCQKCHGTDERGTILSLAQKTETITSSKYGPKKLFRGARVGCWLCHKGSGNPGSANPVGPALVTNLSTNTTSGTPVVMTLAATDTNNPVQTLAVRIISQPARGTVGLTNRIATYFPPTGFVGTEQFTFAAWNGATDSNLGTGTVAVAQGTFGITSTAQVPPSYPAGWAAPFGAVATPSNLTATVTYDWDFGDGTAHGAGQYSTHAYDLPGSYNWKVIATVTSGASKSATNSGTIIIVGPIKLTATPSSGSVTFTWPKTVADAVLEYTDNLGPGALWTTATNTVTSGASTYSVSIPNVNAHRFYRLRKI